jgi:hypothetical protein
MRTKGICNLNISKDLIGTRTRNLLSCSTLPHPTSRLAPFCKVQTLLLNIFTLNSWSPGLSYLPNSFLLIFRGILWRNETGAAVVLREGKNEVKFTLEQATKAQRGTKGIALLFL